MMRMMMHKRDVNGGCDDYDYDVDVDERDDDTDYDDAGDAVVVVAIDAAVADADVVGLFVCWLVGLLVGWLGKLGCLHVLLEGGREGK